MVIIIWWSDANLNFYLPCQYLINGCFSCYKFIEVVVLMCSVKKVFLEISQNSQESTCVRVSFLMKLQAGLQLH